MRSVFGVSFFGVSLRVVALFVVLIFTAPFFFIGGPDYLSSPLHRAIWDLGHFGFFALLIALVQLRWPLRRWQQWLVVAALVFLMGGVIELAQVAVGRDGTWSDVWHNLVGAGLGLFWGQRANRFIWVGRLAASLALLAPLWSVLQIAQVQYDAAQKFPHLADFETQRELLRWQGDIARSKDHASSGQYGLKIKLQTTQYSGFSLNWFLGDWSGHKQLAFDIYNPDGEPLPFVLRIHDETHDRNGRAYTDRLNTRLLAEPGWNYFAIPIEQIENGPEKRSMNLQQLRALGIFVVAAPRARVIYLDNMRLE